MLAEMKKSNMTLILTVSCYPYFENFQIISEAQWVGKKCPNASLHALTTHINVMQKKKLLLQKQRIAFYFFMTTSCMFNTSRCHFSKHFANKNVTKENNKNSGE